MQKNLEKANRLQDPKKRTTPTGGLFFRTLRILRLRPQNPKNPKDPKKRMTPQNKQIIGTKLANFKQIPQECGNFSLEILLLQQLETYDSGSG